MPFLLSVQFLMVETMYIATLFAKESKTVSSFGTLCPGIALSAEGVGFFKKKRRDRDKGGSTVMFLQSFSAYCQTSASIVKQHF